MKKIVKPKPVGKEHAEPKRITFGFRHLRRHSYHECGNADFFIDYIERLPKLCNLDWNTLYTTHRHSFGTENIPVSQLRHDHGIDRDIDSLIALRATGDNHSFLGFRNEDVFEVVFIESNFGDIYNHGHRK